TGQRKTRRTSPMLGGMPIRTSEFGRTKAESEPRGIATRCDRKGESRGSGMTAPTILPGSRAKVGRGASNRLAATGSSQSSEGEEREELMSNPVVSKPGGGQVRGF